MAKYYFGQVVSEYGAILPELDQQFGREEPGALFALDWFESEDPTETPGNVKRIICINTLENTCTILKSRQVSDSFPRVVTIQGMTKSCLTTWKDEPHHCVVSAGLLTALNEVGDYLILGKQGLSYIPKDRISKIPRHMREQPNQTGRVWGRPGRTARKFLGDTLSVNDYEKFSNLWKSRYDFDVDSIQVLNGDDIAYSYLLSNYSPASQGSSLFSSCMRYAKCQDYLGLYVKNPDKISIAVMFDENRRIRSRAMVWKLDDGQTFVDRVFGPSDCVSAYHAWAVKNGYLHRRINGAGHHLYVSGVDAPQSMFCTVQHPKHTRYPFLDTFTYLDVPSGRLTNDNRYRHTISMGGTEGGYGTVRKTFWPLDDNGLGDVAECRRCYEKVDNPTKDNVFVDAVYCSQCLETSFPKCVKCQTRYQHMDILKVDNNDGEVSNLCYACAENRAWQCGNCSKRFFNNVKHVDVPTKYGDTFKCCTSCDENRPVHWCKKCQGWRHKDQSIACPVCGDIPDMLKTTKTGSLSSCQENLYRHEIGKTSLAQYIVSDSGTLLWVSPLEVQR